MFQEKLLCKLDEQEVGGGGGVVANVDVSSPQQPLLIPNFKDEEEVS